MKPETEKITIRVPTKFVSALDFLVEVDDFPSRSEAIRAAIRDLVYSRVELVMDKIKKMQEDVIKMIDKGLEMHINHFLRMVAADDPIECVNRKKHEREKLWKEWMDRGYAGAGRLFDDNAKAFSTWRFQGGKIPWPRRFPWEKSARHRIYWKLY